MTSSSPAAGNSMSSMPTRPVVAALRRRPRLRAGLIQLVYVAGGVVLGLLAARVTAGPTITASQVDLVFADIGVAIIALLSVVYTLLFLNVQFASTTYSPRLHLFRDSPLVWHAFGLFVGTLAFTTTSILNSGSGEQVSVLVPTVGCILVLVSLAVARQLQLSALNSLQLGPVLHSIGSRGRAIIDQLYPEPFGAVSATTAVVSGVSHAIRWPGRAAVLRQLDLPRLLSIAERLDAVLQVRVRVGETVWEQQEIIVLSANPSQPDVQALLSALDTGIERSFEQDPLLAFRLLNDIGLRALSAAINDPYTAVQAIDAIEALLRRLAIAHLDIGVVTAAGGQPRVLLSMPDWDRFVAAGVDELIHASARTPSVRLRLTALIDNLTILSPPERRANLDRRRTELMAP